MSLTFTQITELIDDIAKTNSTSYSTADKTRDVNLALDRAFYLIFQADGRWQFDDSGHSGYPTVTANIVSGTSEYAFTADSGSNLILDIFKVLILPSATATVYDELRPVDAQTDREGIVLRSADATGGVPSIYDKTGKWVKLWPIPNYSATNGIKMLINREASYFLTSDTTKKPGIAGHLHEYLALRPAYQYALRNSHGNTIALRDEVLTLERAITEHYSGRAKDQRRVLRPRITEYR